MSRFHENADNLEADGAMVEYRRKAAKTYSPVMDPAEWIEALHREHWLVLGQLKAAKAATEGERVAHLLADVALLVKRLGSEANQISEAADTLTKVLGETPVTEKLDRAHNGLLLVFRELRKIDRD